MKQEVISFYNEFKCLGGDCRMSCCKGWHIAIDEETLKVHMTGKKRSLFIKTLPGGQKVIRKCFNKCPYHTSSGLCKFQLQDKEEYMPKICRIYPRRSLKFNTSVEACMELSCMEAARIFLSHPDRPKLIPYTDGTLPYLWEVDNDDPDFLKFLEQSRDILMDFIWTGDVSSVDDITAKMHAIYRYVFPMHKLLMEDKQAEAAELLKETPDKYADSDKALPVFFFPVTMLNDLIFNEIYYPGMIVKNPVLFKLIRSYRRLFGKIWERDAEDHFKKALLDMVSVRPHLIRKYRAYLSYSLFITFKEAYEDYYLIGPMLLSFIYTSFLMLFDMVSFHSNNRKLTEEDEIFILSSVEKALRHSVDVSDSFLKKIRKEFL